MIFVYTFGVGGAILLGVGFVLQQRVAAAAPHDERITPTVLLPLLRRPQWLVGIGTMAAGNVLGALALGRGSLTLVEPMGASNLFFTLPLAAVLQRSRLGVSEYLGAAALVAGLAGFMAAAGPARPRDVAVPAQEWVIAGAAIVGVAALLILVARRLPVGQEATLIATAAGLLFGLQDALTQRTLDHLGQGMGSMLTSWQPYALMTVAIAGIALGQNAFKLAPLPASLPALTIAEPLCGIGLGAGLFSQHIRFGASDIAFESLSFVVMAVGVFLVARSPIVTRCELRGG